MAKQKTLYICTSCGSDYPKWSGQCPSCGQWNTLLQETRKPSSTGSTPRAEKKPLSEISGSEHKRVRTGISEFDLICGGGIVPGSVLLIGGEPGIGKSTIALQVIDRLGGLYVSGEESPAQIRSRAERLGLSMKDIDITVSTSLDSLLALMEKDTPSYLVIDSIQTLTSGDIPSSAGSVSQIRDCASRLSDFAKARGLTVFLVGHITKEGTIAGPKVLEHLVDTVLYFEGDFNRDYRILRAFKNRYGSVNEIGLFRMTGQGLEEVEERSSLFLNPYDGDSPGHAVSSVIEGSRSLLVEVQSLVNFTSFPNPRRMSDGIDLNRVIILAAVLEKHAGVKLSSFDIFINIAGGLQIHETAADLAVAVAITSSLKNLPVPEGTGLLGEISLSGEVRPVSQVNRRLQEFRHAGFKRVIISEGDLQTAKSSAFQGELSAVRTIGQTLDLLF